MRDENVEGAVDRIGFGQERAESDEGSFILSSPFSLPHFLFFVPFSDLWRPLPSTS